MPILVCGPFAVSSSPDRPTGIYAALRPQGDWAGTAEGQAEIAKAEKNLTKAVEDGKLPAGTHLEPLDALPGIMNVVIPFNPEDKTFTKEAIRTEVLAATGAALTYNMPPIPTRQKRGGGDDFHSR